MKICHYLIREILLYLAIFFGALFFALLANYISGFLNKAADGYIGFTTVAKLLFYISPNLMLLILPMSIFGGIFTAFRQLSVQNELVAMFSCGVSWKKLFLFASIPVLILTGITLFLSFFIVPKSLADFQMLTQHTTVKSLKYIKPGKFYSLGKNKEVFFDNKKELLLISLNKNHDSLTYASHYSIKEFKNKNFLIMHDGWKDVLDSQNKSIEKLNFKNGLLSLNAKEVAPSFTIAAFSTEKLLSEPGFKSEVELRWRLFTGFLPLTALFFVFPFCGGSTRKNAYLNTILAIGCFLSFSILSSIMKNMLVAGELPLWFGFEILSFIIFINGTVWVILKGRGVKAIGC